MIGSQKAGTTSLYNLLTTHPSICKSRTKETHFFDSDPNFAKGTDFYQSFFKKCATEKVKKIYIDATPDYFTKPHVPERMNITFTRRSMETKKLVLVLREPVSREFSLYEHLTRHCLNGMKSAFLRESFRNSTRNICGERHCRFLKCQRHKIYPSADDSALLQGLDTFSQYFSSGQLFVNNSFYEVHLLKFLQYFKRDQIFVVNFDRLVKETTKVIRQISEFLEIDVSYWGATASLPHSNIGGLNISIDCDSQRRLKAIFEPHNLALYDLLGYPGAPPSQPPFFQFSDPIHIRCQLSFNFQPS